MNNTRNYTLGIIGMILIILVIIYAPTQANAATFGRAAQACSYDAVQFWLVGMSGWWAALILLVVIVFRLTSGNGAGTAARKRIDNLCRQNERLRKRLDAREKRS